MAGALTDYVVLTISQVNVGIARAGFGVPLIVSHSATWTERTRTYGSTLDVSADFATDTPEYLAAAAMFAQSPAPTTIMIGRASLLPTQQYTIGASAVNSTAYSINVVAPGATVSNPYTYTSDASATIQEIHNGLITALNGISGKNFTAAFAPLASLTAKTFTADHTTSQFTSTAHGWNTGDGAIWTSESGGALPTGLTASTNYYIIKIDANTFQLATSLANALANTAVTISDNGTGTLTATPQASCLSPILPFLVTGNSTGDWFSLEILDPTLLSNKQSHADPGVATDLAAIALENSTWYALATNFNSQAYVTAAAAWIETQSKIYLFDVNETAAITTTGGSGGSADTLDALHTLKYTRTAGSYHPSPAAFMSAAWLGRVLPDDPGTETWKFKSLAGVPAVSLTATNRTNLRARKANTIETVAGVNITWDGTTADGNYIDVRRGIDWIQDDMSKGIFGVLSGNEKVPYTDAGVAMVENEVWRTLITAVAKGILASDPKPNVTAPLVSTISAANKSGRILPDIRFTGTLAGAVHSVNLTGVISV